MINFNFKKEKSSGFIVYRRNPKKGVEYLVVRQGNDIWCFPKGHIENRESELQAAIRELREETGLEVRLFLGFKEIISYQIDKNTVKKVVFFMGEGNTDQVQCDGREIIEYRWLPYKEAEKILTFNDLKMVLKKADDALGKIIKRKQPQ